MQEEMSFCEDKFVRHDMPFVSFAGTDNVFMCVFLPTCVLKFVKIKNTFIYICIFQKFFVPLQPQRFRKQYDHFNT